MNIDSISQSNTRNLVRTSEKCAMAAARSRKTRAVGIPLDRDLGWNTQKGS